jgi:DNA-binding transcriptional MerR regulator
MKHGAAALLVADAAKLLNCTPAAVRAMANRGDLAYTRTESGVRIFDRDVVERAAATRNAARLQRSADGGEAA